MRIEIKNLNHEYDVEVLHDLNFFLEKYKSIGIIGVSGSGKSTLIRLMSGIEKPTSGEIFINEMKITKRELDLFFKIIISFLIYL